MAAEPTISDKIDDRDREDAEPKKKLKKKRSIRVSRVISSRRSKSKFTWPPTDLSDSSPNYLNSNGTSYTKEGDSQGVSEWGEADSMVSSSCGSSDGVENPFVVMSDDGALPHHSSSLPCYLYGTSCFEGTREPFLASPNDTDCSYDGSDQSKSSHSAQTNSIYSGKKTMPSASRSSNVRNVRVLMKKTSFKPKRVPLELTHFSEDWNVVRATCSSTIKDSRFPKHVEVEPGVTEADRVSLLKVCRYHHCSLNGHCHHIPVPEKCFPYLRRKSAKPTMSTEASSEAKPIKISSGRKKDPIKNVPCPNIEASVQKGIHLENDKSRGKDISTKARVLKFRGARRNIQGPSLTEAAHKGSQYHGSAASSADDGEGNHLKLSYGNGVSLHSDSTEILQTLNNPACGNYENTEPKFQNVMRTLKPETTLEVEKPKTNKGKNISMWLLIHKHMASDIVAVDAAKPLEGVDAQKEMEKTDAHTAKECSDVSSQCPTSNVEIDSHEIEDEETEISKIFAIKMVREAIEKILLPELDQSSESQSVTSDTVVYQDLAGKNRQGGPAEDCCYNGSSNNDLVENTPADQQLLAHTDNTISEEEKKIGMKSKKKSEKKSPNNWSNLKKWILLQRFIKELEKVKKIKIKKSELESDPEAEKVNLRHQTVDERKRSEEWMLDYALRQVVSQLAPTQKRKVALIVKAFETIVPPQEDFNIQVTIPKLIDKHDKDAYVTDKEALSAFEMKDNKSQAEKNIMSESDNRERSSICEEHSQTNCRCRPVVDGVQSSTTPCMKSDSVTSQQEINSQIISSLKTEDHSRDSAYQSQNTTFQGGVKATENQESLSAGDENSIGKAKTSEEENAIRNPNQGQIIPPEMQQNADLRLISEQSGATKAGDRSIELDNVDEKADEPLNTPPCVLSNKIAETMQPADCLTFIPQDSNGMETVRECQLGPSTDLKYQNTEKETSQLEKQNYMRMWHMVYQHVASSIATKVGRQLLGAEDEGAEDANKSSEMETCGSQLQPTKCNDGWGKEIHEASHLKSEFSRSEVVKLVQEAVDEILLPEILDDTSDTQSVASETMPDQDLAERELDEIWNQRVLSSTHSGHSSDKEEKGSKHDADDSEDSKREKLSDKKKSDAPKLKNWSKLKKLMVLKRSIKAMENARKLEPQPKQLELQPKQTLPPPSLPEPEKIDLRHQMMDERRKAEQWMLDYAVQHIVTKLTPARKTRVAMLVEAFEAVVPLPQV